MDSIPVGAGVLLKWGHATAQPKVREWRFQEDPSNGDVTLVYKTQKLMAKAEEAEIPLSTFFVHKVRPATENETRLVTQFAEKNTVFTLSAKRCFNVDFYETDFALAVGPSRMKTVTLFPAPDASLAEIWSFLSSVMLVEGIFAPSAEDPDVAEVVRVEALAVEKQVSVDVAVGHKGDAVLEDKIIDIVGKKGSIFDTDTATALLNSLPQPTEQFF